MKTSSEDEDERRLLDVFIKTNVCWDSSITFDDFDILASDSHKFKLLIKESLLIKRDKPVVNRRTELFPLDLFDQAFTFNKKYDQFSIFDKKRIVIL